MLAKRALPNRLPVLRAERGVSQMDLAASVGISANRYWRIENGHTEPTSDERRDLAKAFGVSIAAVWPSVAA